MIPVLRVDVQTECEIIFVKNYKKVLGEPIANKKRKEKFG